MDEVEGPVAVRMALSAGMKETSGIRPRLVCQTLPTAKFRLLRRGFSTQPSRIGHRQSRPQCGLALTSRGVWRARLGSLPRIDRYIATCKTNKNSLKKHGRQQAIFITDWDVRPDAYRSDESNVVHCASTDAQILWRQCGKGLLRRAQGATPLSGAIEECEPGFSAVLVEDGEVAAGIELEKDLA
jgi:hypothetical protein